MTEDGETIIATFYEIVELTPIGGGNGIAIAVLHTNSTGRLAPLSGMILAATDYMQPLVRVLQHFGSRYQHHHHYLLLLWKKALLLQ
jgi:hypothetical protein